MSSLLEVIGVSVRYPSAAARDAGWPAVADASFRLDAGEMLGLVGESGCGKTTLGRAILRLVPVSGGEIRWRDRRIDGLSQRRFRPLRRELQIVFQDPHASLDPRMTIEQSVAEPLRALAPELDAAGRGDRVAGLLREVGLAPELARRYPHQTSGGQLQRAVIARALIVDPQFIVCDEPTSALDVSVQGQIINLLARIRRERQLTGLFISHNLAVVANLCERVMVMYRGHIVEIGPRGALLTAPLHPYTRELLDAVPRIDPGARRRSKARMPVAVADLASPVIAGCPFQERCPHVVSRCRTERPPLQRDPGRRQVACHRAGEWPRGIPAVVGD